MSKDVTEHDLEIFANALMEAICENPAVKLSEKDNIPSFIKPYAPVNPYSSDAEEHVAEIASIMHPDKVSKYPEWIQNLVDKGLIDEDGKTVIAKSLETVAYEIMKSNIQVTNIMLKRFINGKNNKPYSSHSINLAVEYANSK